MKNKLKEGVSDKYSQKDLGRLSPAYCVGFESGVDYTMKRVVSYLTKNLQNENIDSIIDELNKKVYGSK